MTSTLRILHCLRAPSGGLFRHVHDLALAQAQLGAEVGIVFDSRLEGDPVTLGRLADNCVLGITRFPMGGHASFGDWRATAKIPNLPLSSASTFFTVTAPRGAPMHGLRRASSSAEG